jgi:hypothetical protein
MLLAAYAFSRLNRVGAGVIAAAIGFFTVVAMRIRRRGEDAGGEILIHRT